MNDNNIATLKKNTTRFGLAASVIIGVSLVAVASGRTVFASFLGVGVLLAFFSGNFRQSLGEVVTRVRSPLGLALALLLISWSISALMSFDQLRSLEVVVRMAAFIFLSGFIYQQYSGGALNLEKTLKVALVVFLLVMAILIVSYFYDRKMIYLVKFHDYPTRIAAIQSLQEFSSASVTLAPFVLWAGYRLGGKWNFASLIITSAMLAVVIISKSGAAAAGFAGVALVLAIGFLFVKSSRVLRFVLPTAMGLFFVTVIVGHYFNIFQFASRKEYPPELLELMFLPPEIVEPARQIIWRHIIDLAMLKPWFGWGMNVIDWVDATGVIAPITVAGFSSTTTHPHNWIVEVFSETGILGLLAMLVAILVFLWPVIKSVIGRGSATGLAVLSISAGFWVSSLFNFSFWSSWWQVLYLVLIATVMAGEQLTRSREPR